MLRILPHLRCLVEWRLRLRIHDLRIVQFSLINNWLRALCRASADGTCARNGGRLDLESHFFGMPVWLLVIFAFLLTYLQRHVCELLHYWIEPSHRVVNNSLNLLFNGSFFQLSLFIAQLWVCVVANTRMRQVCEDFSFVCWNFC